jgi:ABC-type multidrug transport system ATPase subunit
LISEFKLEGTENTLIGGQFKKGVSGGQRKRVNIALELISDPPVIFLDEPTSGLDSYTSEIVIKKLDELAKKYGKTIIYVIHQPSSDIFKKMDQLMLLYKGKTIYFGDAGQPSVDYFERIGFKCDNDTNPSDFFMYIM